MLLLFTAEPAAADEPDEQPSSMERAKVWVRKGAEKMGPVLKKAGSMTLSGLKKAGAAGVGLTKTAASRVRAEIAKRRDEEPDPESALADNNEAEAAPEEVAPEEAAAEEVTDK